MTVAYGERLGRAAITARGDVVAVAYEDPNTTPPRVGVAFSRTMGHTFESRELVSPASAPADAPGIALGTASIAVTWKSGAGSGAAAPRMLRVGTLR